MCGVIVAGVTGDIEIVDARRAQEPAQRERAGDDAAPRHQSQFPPLQLFVQVAPAAHSKWHPPPLQLFVQCDPSLHSMVQLPPEQKFVQSAPDSHVKVQWPPEQSFVASDLSPAVNLQWPLGQSFLQVPVQSHDAVLIASQATPTVGWLTLPLDDEDVLALPELEVVPPLVAWPPLLVEAPPEEEDVLPDGSGSSSRRLLTVQATREETMTPAKIHRETIRVAPEKRRASALSCPLQVQATCRGDVPQILHDFVAGRVARDALRPPGRASLRHRRRGGSSRRLVEHVAVTAVQSCTANPSAKRLEGGRS